MGAFGGRSWPRTVAIGVVLLAITVAFLYYFVGWQIRAAPQQPAPMNHEVMVEAGVSCLFCHSGALRSPAAGIPSVQLCMGCHTVIKPDSPKIQEIAAYWDRQEPIPWARVYRLPRFVYFTHRIHVSSGLNCERCHGDVAQMEAAQPAVKMNMGWCLSCHNDQPNAEQLRDCAICHK